MAFTSCSDFCCNVSWNRLSVSWIVVARSVGATSTRPPDNCSRSSIRTLSIMSRMLVAALTIRWAWAEVGEGVELPPAASNRLPLSIMTVSGLLMS